MMDFEDLADLHEIIPGIRTVTLYPMGAGSVLGSAITVTAAEKRPTDRKDEAIVARMEIELDATVFHLWTSTFSSTHKVSIDDVIVEANGDRWQVKVARLEMGDTRWRCLCVQMYGKPD